MSKTKILEAIAYIEKEFPETSSEFLRVQKEQYGLFCLKQKDYGPSNIAMGTQLKDDEELNLSQTGLIIRMNDKIQRLINLVIKNKRRAENESTQDSYQDLSIYGIIAQIVSNRKWGK